MTVNDASRIVIDYAGVMLQIVALLADHPRDIFYDRSMFTVQATGLIFAGKVRGILHGEAHER
jgi:hypothetical protein